MTMAETMDTSFPNSIDVASRSSKPRDRQQFHGLSENPPLDNHTRTYKTFQDDKALNHESCTVDDVLETERELSNCQDGTTFSIQEAVDVMGFGAYQIKISCMFGLANIAEAMELMLISVLSPTLKCVFQLSSSQESILSLVFFGGMLLCGNAWGKLGDTCGRKASVMMSSMIYGYFGVLTSFSPAFPWIVINRFIVALGVGGFHQTVTLYSEFIPTKSRSTALILIALIWSMGACLELLLAMVTLTFLTWRWLLFFTAFPTLVFVSLYKFLPESPRYLLSHGRHQEAVDILKDVARSNGKQLPEGRLRHASNVATQQNQFREIFKPKFLRTTLLVGLAMATSYMSYYGTVLLTTSLLEINDGCHGYNAKPPSQFSCWSVCSTLGWNDYLDLLITTLGDIPGLLICVGLMYKLGRLTSLATLMTIYTLVMLLCNICFSRNILVALLFCARAMGNGTAQGILVYISEVYPTPVRAIGMGWCGSTRGAGAIIAAGLSTVLVRHSAFLGISSFAAIGLIGALAFIFLPYETKDKSMAVFQHTLGYIKDLSMIDKLKPVGFLWKTSRRSVKYRSLWQKLCRPYAP